MTIVPLFLLTFGAINWGYAYPLVFLFVALLRQRMLGREIYFNFLYAPGFWLLLSAGMTYVIIVLCGIQNRKSHLLLMPLIAGSLNFAWEINALLLSRGFYGHVLWTGLDVLIVVHNVRFLEKGKRKKYLLLIVVFILVLYGMFRIPNVDGQRISVFAIDLIMAIEYVLCAKQIAPQGRISVGVLKLLGDLFAWLSNMQSSVFVAVCGLIVLLLNLFYLAICLEQSSHSRKKVQR